MRELAMRWLPIKLLRVILRQWKLLTAALVAAGIIHIWSTLNASQILVSPGYARLVRDLPINTTKHLAPIVPRQQRLAFMMPNARYAVCRYDATKSPIRLVAVLPEIGWSLSLHAPNGANFYFVPGSRQRVTKLDLTIQPKGIAFINQAAPNTISNIRRPKVLLPHPHGIAILTAPVKGLAYRRLIDEQMSSFRCLPIRQTTANR